MARYAVGYINYFDNEMVIEIVQANNWHEALAQHSQIGEMEYPTDDIKEAKQEFFNCDSMFDVKLIED